MPRDIKYITPVSDQELLDAFWAVYARLANPDHWCKGRARFGKAVDLPNALLDASAGNRSLHAAMRNVLDEVGHRNIYEFNDHATHDQVLELISSCRVHVDRRRRKQGERQDQMVAFLAVVVVFLFLAVMYAVDW